MQLARIYDDPPGPRYLIDRLWPRGVSKERAQLEGWLKDIAPSDALRRAYHAGEVDHPTFSQLYLDELANQTAPSLPGDAVLVTAAKELEASHGPILLKWLQGDPPRPKRT
ncbi:MAG: DUF488 domain-containing protein [Thermoplasmatota archaeon]